MTDIDLHYADGALLRDPWEEFARLRRESPVVRTRAAGGYWILTRYDDIVAAGLDTGRFCSGEGVSIPRLRAPAPLLPFEVDPPRHMRFRALVMRHFTSRALAAFTPVAERICASLADGLVGRSECDLMAGFVLPASCHMFAAHLGVPEDDWHRTVDWLRPWVEPPFDQARLNDGLTAYDDHLTELSRAGAMRSESLLADIATASLDGTLLTDDERHGLRFTMLLAGVETTLYALGGALLLLASDEPLQDKLRADASLIPAFVEEALRLEGPAMGHTRTLTRDVELRGQTLRAGERVLLLWASGSRDEERFAAGATVDLPSASTRHLAFGVGPHRCAGAPLARIEMRVALQALLSGMPAFRLDPAHPIEWHPHARGVMALEVQTR